MSVPNKALIVFLLVWFGKESNHYRDTGCQSLTRHWLFFYYLISILLLHIYIVSVPNKALIVFLREIEFYPSITEAELVSVPNKALIVFLRILCDGKRHQSRVSCQSLTRHWLFFYPSSALATLLAILHGVSVPNKALIVFLLIFDKGNPTMVGECQSLTRHWLFFYEEGNFLVAQEILYTCQSLTRHWLFFYGWNEYRNKMVGGLYCVSP